jgi:hypothetical protein
MKKNSKKSLLKNKTESTKDMIISSATNKQEHSLGGLELQEDDLLE